MSNKANATAMKKDCGPELMPKLRFPEFRDAEGWDKRELGYICQMQAGRFVSASEIREQNTQGLYPCYGGNGLRGYTTTFTHSGRFSLIGRQGALCGNVRFGVGQFHATEHAVVVTPKSGINGEWLFYVLGFLNLNRFATGQAQPGLSVDVLEKLSLAVPNQETEQQKIAECLTSADELIAAHARKVDALKTHKQGLMKRLFPREGETQPRVRFPEFQDAAEWDEDTVEEIIATVTPPKRLQTSDYQSEGEFPIVDQSQNYICGWTNDGEAVIDEGLPVIVFGDHTCALKYVDRPFVQEELWTSAKIRR
jgi:type I restriction enzyme, S subunit